MKNTIFPHTHLTSACRAGTNRKANERNARLRGEEPKLAASAAPDPPMQEPSSTKDYRGHVQLAADLSDTRIMDFFIRTHSREYLLDLARELGIPECTDATTLYNLELAHATETSAFMNW